MKFPAYTKIAKVEGDLKGADLTWEWEWSGTEHGIAGPNVFPLRDSVVVTNKAIGAMSEVPPNSGVLTLTPVITCDGGSEMRLDALVLTVGLSFVNPNAPCCVGVEGGGSGQDCNMYSPWKYLAVATEDNSRRVVIYNKNFELLDIHLDLQIAGSAYDVAFSPDGRYLAVVGYVGYFYPNGKVLLDIFRTSDWQKVASPQIVGGNAMLAWSPDGKYLAVSGYTVNSNSTRSGIVIVTVDEWSVIQGPDLEYARVEIIAWSPDGKYLAATRWNEYEPLYIIDPSDWSWDIAINEGVESNTRCMEWSPDGKYLCTGGKYEYQGVYNTIYPEVYDTKTWTLVSGLPRIQEPNNPAYSCAWSPDSRYLAIGHHNYDFALSVVDMQSKTLVDLDASLDLAGFPIQPVWSAEFSPDGKYLVAGYAAGNGIVALSVPGFERVDNIDPVPGSQMPDWQNLVQAYALSFAKANCCPR
jgi:WD40 repeat protein